MRRGTPGRLRTAAGCAPTRNERAVRGFGRVSGTGRARPPGHALVRLAWSAPVAPPAPARLSRTASTASEPIYEIRRSVTVVPTWAAVDSTGSGWSRFGSGPPRRERRRYRDGSCGKLTGDLDGRDPAERAAARRACRSSVRQLKWKRHDNQEEDLGIAARACLSWRDDIASPFLIVVARRSRACFDGRT